MSDRTESSATEQGSITRRDFVRQAGGAALVTSISARSYARVIGANDRIRIGQLGSGSRGTEHIEMVKLASRQTPVETVAVCDLWSVHRERAAAFAQRVFGGQVQAYKYPEEMLSRPDIDGVMIATGDFQHAKLCAQVVRAGKDCYVEKPFANVLADAKEARDAVKSSKQVVQMGTQHRSQPYPLAVRDIIRSGRIGRIIKIEQEWNVNQPRWRRNEVKQLREEDTDWRRWLLGKPYEPFDPHKYLEFRLYKNYSSGLFDQWLSHGSDLVHLWSDETHPVSAVATGGVFRWPDGRENPDTCTVALTYPKGFLYMYTSTFGNSYRSFARIQGSEGTIENFGGEGASLFMVTREGGPHEFDPADTHKPLYTSAPDMGPAEDHAEILRLPNAPRGDNFGPDDNDVHHLGNWLQAVRDRQQPNANVDHGFSHAIVCIIAAQSYWSGKKLHWDPNGEEIVETAPAGRQA